MAFEKRLLYVGKNEYIMCKQAMRYAYIAIIYILWFISKIVWLQYM